MGKKVTLEKLMQEFRLEVIYGWDQLDRAVTVADLYRPGLELAGFFTYHPVERLQLLGKTELSFIEGIDQAEKRRTFGTIVSLGNPCFIVTRQLEVPRELILASKKKKVPILRTSLATTKFASKLTNYLEKYLAPATTMHGVLVDVYGIGVLITGSSGIGKVKPHWNW